MIDRWRMHLLLLVCSVFRLNCYIRFCILITDQFLFCVLTRLFLENRKKGGIIMGPPQERFPRQKK